MTSTPVPAWFITEMLDAEPLATDEHIEAMWRDFAAWREARVPSVNSLSQKLEPGTRLRHRKSRKVVMLDRRKEPPKTYDRVPFWPGWWLADGDGGLADSVIDAENSDWEVLS